MITRLVLKGLHGYRVSGGGRRWFGIHCNFEPSCSAYAEEVIRRFGLGRGGVLAWRRIRRCREPDAVCKCLEPVPESLEDA